MIEEIFLASVIKRFKEYKTLADKTFAQLDDVQFTFQPNETSNSIAIIIHHMHGNMQSRWTNFLTEDGEKQWRNRDAEFEPATFSKAHALQLWEEGWQTVFDALNKLQPADLSKTITIRQEPLSVVDAIVRQTAHYSNHIGQIIYLGKWLKDADWQTLSIPKKGSQQFNKEMQNRKH